MTQNRAATHWIVNSPIVGISEELNLIASRNLDFAYTRRRFRSACSEVQQQLDHCLFKLAPSGIRTEEWSESNSKGLEIFCRSWMPKTGVRIKGVLFFCHGYGDTCTFFFEGIVRHIVASGYGVSALDHPAFGLSEGLHCYIPRFDELVDNGIEIYTTFKGRPELQKLPCFILGQSMGGAVTIQAHLKEPHAWDGVVLVAQMCKIAEEVITPAGVLKVLSLLARVDLAELAFRDLRNRKMAVHDVICYSDIMQLKTAVELLNATSDIEKQVEKVSSALLILHGAADKVTYPLVSKFLYEKASSRDKTLMLSVEGYHCIIEGEPDDKIFTVLGDIILWLNAKLNEKFIPQTYSSTVTKF